MQRFFNRAKKQLGMILLFNFFIIFSPALIAETGSDNNALKIIKIPLQASSQIPFGKGIVTIKDNPKGPDQMLLRTQGMTPNQRVVVLLTQNQKPGGLPAQMLGEFTTDNAGKGILIIRSEIINAFASANRAQENSQGIASSGQTPPAGLLPSLGGTANTIPLNFFRGYVVNDAINNAFGPDEYTPGGSPIFESTVAIPNTVTQPTQDTIADACQQGKTPIGNIRLNTNEVFCLQDAVDYDQRQMSFYVTGIKVGRTLEVILSHGKGDATLLHRYDSRPSKEIFDNISDNLGNEERLIIPNIKEGWNYIHVQGNSDFSDVSLRLLYIDQKSKGTAANIIDACQQGSPPVGNVALTINEVACLRDLKDDTNQMAVYVNDEHIGRTLEILLSHGSGDADVIYRYNSRPNGTAYDALSNNEGNEERLLIPNVKGGWNYIHVEGDNAFSGTSLLVRYL